MATQSDLTTANGVAKRVHGDVVSLVPRRKFKTINRIKYKPTTVVGSEFAESVWLTEEHGFTFGGTAGTKRTLNESEVAENQLATATPSAIDFRTEVVIDLLSRARARGEQAFEKFVTRQMHNSKLAFDKRLEVLTLYGGSPLATLASATDAVTTSVMTVEPAEWAPGIWLGSKNMRIDAYNGATQLNTDGDLRITSVAMGAYTITVTGTADDIDRVVAGGASVDLYYKGQYGNDFTGLRTIANLTTGTYLNISADTYTDVWQGTQGTWTYGDDLTWTLIQDTLEEAAGRGMDGDVIATVPLNGWNDLNAQLAALRVIDSSYDVTKIESGHAVDAISFHTITGKVTVEASTFVKRGEVIIYPDPDDKADQEVTPKRIGSSDVTFNVPGRNGEEMFHMLENSNTFEKRAFSDQMLWLPAPCSCALLT